MQRSGKRVVALALEVAGQLEGAGANAQTTAGAMAKHVALANDADFIELAGFHRGVLCQR